jgi:hypothetical protein
MAVALSSPALAGEVSQKETEVAASHIANEIVTPHLLRGLMLPRSRNKCGMTGLYSLNHLIKLLITVLKKNSRRFLRTMKEKYIPQV